MARKKKGYPYRKTGDFPDCPHLHYFKCSNVKDCLGCYYNPNKKESMWVEPGEEKKLKNLWFYHYKRHSKKMLEILEDIRTGKGLFPNGTRYYFRYSRKNDDDDES